MDTERITLKTRLRRHFHWLRWGKKWATLSLEDHMVISAIYIAGAQGGRWVREQDMLEWSHAHTSSGPLDHSGSCGNLLRAGTIDLRLSEAGEPELRLTKSGEALLDSDWLDRFVPPIY